jgi:hypothetical protein
MRIPNRVEPGQNLGLAVHDWAYWATTTASYYINIPGYEVEEACVWGNNTVPAGNVSTTYTLFYLSFNITLRSSRFT